MAPFLKDFGEVCPQSRGQHHVIEAVDWIDREQRASQGRAHGRGAERIGHLRAVARRQRSAELSRHPGMTPASLPIGDLLPKAHRVLPPALAQRLEQALRRSTSVGMAGMVV